MQIKMFNPAHEKTVGFSGLISARAAADRLGLAHHTFFKALDTGILHPQAKIDGEKPAYGFVPAYIEEIAKVIPIERIGGQKVFTSEIKAKIGKINQKWDKLHPLG